MINPDLAAVFLVENDIKFVVVCFDMETYRIIVVLKFLDNGVVVMDKGYWVSIVYERRRADVQKRETS